MPQKPASPVPVAVAVMVLFWCVPEVSVAQMPISFSLMVLPSVLTVPAVHSSTPVELAAAPT